ncbi:MAG: aldo/keto reductase [Thermoproteota archaeon]|jgi:aryl-alcohol dehydrogenase-like predicted oxidoreductase|nr:aldo/keto reductase [Thermoproteota archaeon]
MKYRKLGKSGISVSEIGFGAWTIGMDWWGNKIDDIQAIRMLKRAYDIGINFYETADVYGKGKSEKLLAQAFAGMHEGEIVYSTKWGYDFYNAEQVGHNELPQKHHADFLQFALRQSMKRLQVDYIDVYSLHNPKINAIQDDELFLSLDALVKDGKIGSHGVALGPAIGWEKEGLEAMQKRNITCLQTVYNIIEQDPGRSFLDSAREYNVGLLVRVPDASGVLTGKVNDKTVFDKNDHRSTRKREWILESMQKVEKLRPMSVSNGWSITELAIKFVLSQKEVSAVLPTATDANEIEMFAQMSDGKYLSESELSQVTELYNNSFFV